MVGRAGTQADYVGSGGCDAGIVIESLDPKETAPKVPIARSKIAVRSVLR